MEREANYAAVGAFVVLVVVMAGLFVYWYSDTHEHREYARYEIYFDGSVAGLTRGAAVRYLGVDVGRVIALHVDPHNASRVQVIAAIDVTAPISDRTVAQLSMQGITGVLYIDLLQSPRNVRLAEAVPSERYPVIRSTRSNLDVLLAGLPEMVKLASGAIERLDRVMSDDNIASISETLGNLGRASADLPGTLHQVRDLVADLQSSSGELRATLLSVHSIVADSAPQLRQTLERVATVADRLASASTQINQLIAENRSDLRAFTRDSLPELQPLLHDARDAAAEIRDLARSLRQDPTQILYQPRQGGVEIPR
ncbi:MAG TPA: MlaD family protein [Steroidobacteraceae bacterium]|nr:MlaD family protein [Steroidobacteraceae bacterium]